MQKFIKSNKLNAIPANVITYSPLTDSMNLSSETIILGEQNKLSIGEFLKNQLQNSQYNDNKQQEYSIDKVLNLVKTYIKYSNDNTKQTQKTVQTTEILLGKRKRNDLQCTEEPYIQSNSSQNQNQNQTHSQKLDVQYNILSKLFDKIEGQRFLLLNQYLKCVLEKWQNTSQGTLKNDQKSPIKMLVSMFLNLTGSQSQQQQNLMAWKNNLYRIQSLINFDQDLYQNIVNFLQFAFNSQIVKKSLSNIKKSGQKKCCQVCDQTCENSLTLKRLFLMKAIREVKDIFNFQ